jgi:hypothetical protein
LKATDFVLLDKALPDFAGHGHVVLGIAFMRPTQRLTGEGDFEPGSIGEKGPYDDRRFPAFKKFTGGILVEAAHQGIQFTEVFQFILGHGGQIRVQVSILRPDGGDNDRFRCPGLYQFDLVINKCFIKPIKKDGLRAALDSAGK